VGRLAGGLNLEESTIVMESDPEYSGLPIDELKARAGDVRGSVVSRGRAILEVGRRSADDADLGAILVTWAKADDVVLGT
jgi:hypothetical protein